MAITYTNKKGITYDLCYSVNSEGNRVYFLSNRDEFPRADEMPAGHRFHESENGSVRLVRDKSVTNKPRAKADTKPKGAAAPTQKPQPSMTQPAPKRPLAPGMTRCPVCGQAMKQTGVKRHIQAKHPLYSPSRIIAMTAKKPSKQGGFRRSSPPMQGGKVYKPKKKPQAEPFECGWCYQPIWRFLQSSGYYRYYDDKELTRKHKCTRPVHWRPDKD
jgi:hypothetical protein